MTYQEQLDRIETMKGTDTLVSFCTNPMMDRGTVFRCRIAQDGTAVVVNASSWWSTQYIPLEGKAGMVLGAVVPQIRSGSLNYCLSVAGYREGNG